MASTIWSLPAAVDLDHAPEMLRELAGQVATVGSDALTVDVSATQAFDSSLLALLLEARRRLQAGGGKLSVVGAPTKLVELARLYGVDQLVLGEPVQPSA